MRSLMLGLDSVASRRSLARWAFLRLVSGEGGGACSTAVQRSSQYSCRFCRSFSMSGRRVKYGLADTPTTVGAPSGTREEHLVSTPPGSTAPATLSFCKVARASFRTLALSGHKGGLLKRTDVHHRLSYNQKFFTSVRACAVQFNHTVSPCVPFLVGVLHYLCTLPEKSKGVANACVPCGCVYGASHCG